MLTWSQFKQTRPDLAEAGAALLYQFGVGLAFLATVRADGAPRVNPFCPLLVDDALLAFVVPGPKRADLRRDGRYAMHTFPPADNEDAFSVSGIATRVADAARWDPAQAQFLQEREMREAPPDFAAQDLYELTFDRCLLTRTTGHGDWNPQHTVWRAG